MYIYKITNTVNGMTYVGQTKNWEHRKYSHKHYLKNNKHQNQHLQYSWNKYGENCFTFEIIDNCVFIWSSDNLERFWIKFYKSNDRKFGFNKESGGCYRKEVSIETRKLLSKINKENPTRPMLGRKHSDEAKKKMMKKKHSAAEKERMSLRGKEYKGINNPFYGKKHTEAFKQKLSNFKKIPIICITNGIEYDCAKTAASALGLTQSHVTQVCNGRYKAAKGYVFKYDL